MLLFQVIFNLGKEELQVMKRSLSFPENYHTCFGFFKLLSTFARVVTLGKQGKEDAVADTENQVAVGGQVTHGKQGKEEEPPALTKLLSLVTLGKQGKKDAVANTENHVAVGGQRLHAPAHRNFPENYATCYELLKSANMEVLGLTGFGLAGIRKIKEKNTWSYQIMEELLQRNTMYSFTEDGK
ncbi:Ankyrin repeat-containing protein [Quillaja saponaria]|uniref:Ankyrin repeat-containing protein n=1 Tax=Quillaja saponaria TaxID=32244 RepID=A0AAD7VEI3_QUISA|nr:Ankyrin repeat-containing protein [Quillaja saponaria]